MRSTRGPTATLIADTVRGHRRGIVAWVAGGSLAMYAMAAGLAAEAARYEGGLPALARSVEAGAQAMRLLRWPAERLDTLGGYVTYHNLTLFVFFLSLYAGTQGVGAVRGAEASLAVDAVLATGRSRAQVVRDRALGFGLTLLVIGTGFALGLAASMGVGGAPDTTGSVLSALACVICAFAAYGLGALVGQLVGGARAGSGLTAVIITGLYLATNVADELGFVGAVRYLSPFYAFTRSRALVPGQGFDVVAASVSLAATALLLVLAGWAFEHRDVGAALWARPARSAAVGPVQRPVLGRLWTATLARERWGLVAWGLGAACWLGLLAWLEPAVRDVWDDLGMTALIGGDPDLTMTDQYLSFAGEIITPVVAAFVITQGAGWVADLAQGRTELSLAAPLTWTGLIVQRMAALVAGAAVIAAGGVLGLVVGALAVGAPVGAAGLVRLALDTVLFGAAFGAVAALVVAWLRTGVAVVVLAVVTGASYLLVLLVPLFAWPDWLTHVSLFGAFGHPYVEVPETAGLVVLSVLVVVGTALAARVAERSPKTA